MLLEDRTLAMQQRAEIVNELANCRDRIGRVEMAVARVPVLEPVVWKLEEKRIAARGVKDFFKSRYTLAAGAIGAGVGGWHQWERISGWAAKLFK